MIELFQKSLFATIGIATMTKDKVEVLGKKIITETRLSEVEGKKFINELLQKSSDARLALEKVIQNAVDASITALKIPTRKEIDDITKRIERLESDKFNDGK
jgi:polyhydroxyalkanoate synthesis regulator phasin